MLCGTMAQSPQRKKLIESKSDFCLLIFSHCLIIYSVFLGLIYTEQRCPAGRRVTRYLNYRGWVSQLFIHFLTKRGELFT